MEILGTGLFVVFTCLYFYGIYKFVMWIGKKLSAYNYKNRYKLNAGERRHEREYLRLYKIYEENRIRKGIVERKPCSYKCKIETDFIPTTIKIPQMCNSGDFFYKEEK